MPEMIMLQGFPCSRPELELPRAWKAVGWHEELRRLKQTLHRFGDKNATMSEGLKKVEERVEVEMETSVPIWKFLRVVLKRG